MADDKKKYNIMEDSFKLSSQVMRHGYDATIDGRRFVAGFGKDYNGRRLSQFASICSLNDSPDGQTYVPINPPQYTIGDLSERQLYELVHAGAFELTEQQEIAFREKFRGFIKPAKRK
jgi:hypothetical protein